MKKRAMFYNREIFSGKRLPCAVISVGNMTLGGTGKTPMVIYLAEKIRDMGYRVAILSRGYGGSLQKQGGVVSDGEKVFLNQEEAGDEPLLMAMKLPGIPVVVGSDRASGGGLCIDQWRTQVILLDDGFQHMKLCRDLDILLADHKSPLGNGHVFPRGPLREPPTAMARAHALVYTRTRQDMGVPELACWPEDRPIFFSAHEPAGIMDATSFGQGGFFTEKTSISLSAIRGKKIFAFSGIGKNDSFFNTLSSIGLSPAQTLEFKDHRNYNEGDRSRIAEEAGKAGADAILTTEKDAVRLSGWDPGIPFYSLGISFRMGDPERFDGMIRHVLEKALNSQ